MFVQFKKTNSCLEYYVFYEMILLNRYYSSELLSMDLAEVMEFFFKVYENKSTYWIICLGTIPALSWDLFIIDDA